MKRILALALSLALAVSLAACGGSTQAAATQTQQTQPVTEPLPRENKLIYGSNGEIDGDFTSALVEGSTGDHLVSDLLNDYTTLVTDRNGKYVENPTVLESMERKDNDDGTATYTIKIKKGLRYSSGEAITAKDFALRTLLSCSAAAEDLGISAAAAIVGTTDFGKGTDDYVSGIRILDEYTLSLEITEDSADYYYADTYAAVMPWSPSYWLGEGWDIVDEGWGAAFAKDGKVCQLRAVEVMDHFAAAKDGSLGEFVSAGPYSLVSFDKELGQVELAINPHYAGNFEGQKPAIETLIITTTDSDTWADAMKSGDLDLYENITDGGQINTVLDLMEEGYGYQYVSFPRAGYHKLQFFCDVTPTQFVEVRQALAMLLDRSALAEECCLGWGGTVDGPYAHAMYQYQHNAQRLAESLNPYSYDPEAAIARLTEGGWVLNEEGGEYTQGLRYKEVTQEQAQYMSECITLEDGRILMPLILKWCTTEANPASDVLTPKLVDDAQITAAGMQIRKQTMDLTALLDVIYRTGGNPGYSMTNLSSAISSALYDHSYRWSVDPEHIALGYNTCYLYDGETGGLDQLSMDMVSNKKIKGKEAVYLDLWADYVERWNQLLPELPLYTNTHITALPDWVEGYEQNALWNFARAVLYASIPDAR